MNLFDLCVYKNLNKESGGDVDVSSLVATENKTYNAGEGKAYNPVVVNVPEPVLDSITINENGHFTPPAGTDGYDDITVYVPYVTQGTTINENGTYTPPEGVDGFERVIVDVPTPSPSLQSLTASHNGYFVPSSGYVGFSEVNVDVALPQNAYLLESQKNDVVTIQHGAEFDMPKLIASIEPQQSGSGDPSPTNIRPISGWTACNVVRSGENLFDKATITENKIIDSTTGEEIAFYGRFSSDYIKVNPSTDYYASNVIRAAQWYCVFYYDKNKNYLSCGELPSTGDTASGVVTIPSGCNYVRLIGVSTYKDDVSFVVGNQSPSSYSAYNGNTYTINFVDGSSPLTVYKGELDVLSGLLKVYPHYDSYNGETINGEWISDRDAYSVGATPTIGAEVQVISGSDYTTYQQTANNVKSLEGVNNLWADTGEVDVQIWTKEVTS